MQRRLLLVLLCSTILVGCATPGGGESSPAAPVTPAGGDVIAQPEPRPPEEERSSVLISLHSPTELLGGKREPSREWRVRADLGYGLALAPDGATALLFPGDPWAGEFAPYLVDLATGAEIPLPLPGDGWYSFGGWLPDGRLALVGRELWVGGPRGENLRRLADETFSWSAWPSPDGRYLALWAPTQSGEAQVVDLETGAVQQVTGPFRRGCQDCGLTLAWSPDGTQLAGTDHDHDAGSAPPRIRVVDPFTDQPVRTIDGFSLAAWLPDGDLLAWEKARGMATLLQIDQAGKERARYPDYGYPSADGRFLLKVEQESSTLLETATGIEVTVTFPGHPRWTQNGEILTTTEGDQERPGS